MGISKMKDELHARLWSAQQRWFTLKEQGWTKHDLKMQGIRERGDMFFATRGIIFTGATRLAYEHELKRFLDYAHTVRGKVDNSQVDKKDFRAYMESRLAKGGAKAAKPQPQGDGKGVAPRKPANDDFPDGEQPAD